MSAIRAMFDKYGGWVIGGLVGCAGVFVIGVMGQMIVMTGAVQARGLPGKMVTEVSDSVVNRSKEAGIDPLRAGYLSVRMTDCATDNVKPGKFGYRKLVGWSGFGTPSEDQWRQAVNNITAQCAKDYVLTSDSVQDAIDRNLMLEEIRMAPYQREQLAVMNF